MKRCFVVGIICICTSCEPGDEETFGPTNAVARADFAGLAEEVQFADENRSYDTNTVYSIPQKLDYISLAMLDTSANGANNIYPIGFSANWKQFVYISQGISPNHNHVWTQLVIVDPKQPETPVKVDLDTSYKLMKVEEVWNISQERITRELRKFSIIQNPLFAFGETFTGRFGKIMLKNFDAFMKRIEEKGNGKHVANVIYVYNDKNDSTIFKWKPQLYGTNLKGYGTLGAFVGKRFLLVFTIISFTDMLNQNIINYSLEWCPLDITTYKATEKAFK